MNRENKRKQYEKGYYKIYPCKDVFTCKQCGRPVFPGGAGNGHRNHFPELRRRRDENTTCWKDRILGESGWLWRI